MSTKVECAWDVVDDIFVFFFFQAEDGIRDWSVTGVQTCALPISIILNIFFLYSVSTSPQSPDIWFKIG